MEPRISVSGVDYLHTHPAEGDDLFLTAYGLPFREWLQPANWFDSAWFKLRRERLLGSSTICKIPTKPVRGRSLNLVVRYSRVGERVPVDTDTLCRNVNSEFNSPFAEVSRVMTLRARRGVPPGHRLFCKRPLAIYSPGERLADWQSGRLPDKFALAQACHPELPLEFDRQYIVLYGWIKGRDAEQTADAEGLTGEDRLRFLTALQERAERELAHAGFRVVDMKPAHIILRRRRDGQLLRWRDGALAYAMVDYELLEPLPSA